jgi:hypothetical protein
MRTSIRLGEPIAARSVLRSRAFLASSGNYDLPPVRMKVMGADRDRSGRGFWSSHKPGDVPDASGVSRWSATQSDGANLSRPAGLYAVPQVSLERNDQGEAL